MKANSNQIANLKSKSLLSFNTLIHRLLPILAVILFIAAVWVLYRQLRDHSVREIWEALQTVPPQRIALAAIFTIAGYAILTGYDFLSLRYIRHELPFMKVAKAALVGYGISNSVGHSFLTGGTVRFRLYSQWGLKPGEIARVIVFSHVTFYLGMLVLVGLACIIEPGPIAREVRLNDLVLRVLGGVMVTLALLYFAFIRVRTAPIPIAKWAFPVPPVRLSLAQLVIGSLDMALAAAVLWVLLPPAGMTFAAFLGLFMVAQMIGVGSQVPGGLGVFEALMMHVIDGQAGEPQVLSALLLFRLIYFIIPLAIAAAWLGVHELQVRRAARNHPGADMT